MKWTTGWWGGRMSCRRVGRSMVGEQREFMYGEHGEEKRANRMIHDGRHKLIYYPAGNCLQLFDLEEDPAELRDLSGQSDYAGVRERLEKWLIGELYGGDEAWVTDGKLTGLPGEELPSGANRGLSGQRGGHWPPPPYRK